MQEINADRIENADIKMYSAEDISQFFGMNGNNSRLFLKKFGNKIGTYQIEQNKLLEVLRSNEGKNLLTGEELEDED